VNFLIDENLSPRVAELMTKAGHNAVHVRDLRATSAPDAAIMALAVADERVIVSADTDFGALLAQSRATEPSVILVRELLELRPPELVNIILAQLELLQSHLRTGAICAFTTGGIRVRALPLR
jgi:predicted nuclease of predicted toxin-antitoxin system